MRTLAASIAATVVALVPHSQPAPNPEGYYYDNIVRAYLKTPEDGRRNSQLRGYVLCWHGQRGYTRNMLRQCINDYVQAND